MILFCHARDCCNPIGPTVWIKEGIRIFNHKNGEHITPTLLSKSCSPSIEWAELSLKIEDPFPLVDPVAAAVTSALLLPIPGSVTGIQREVSKTGWMISKTSDITAKISAKINKRWVRFIK